MRVCVVVRVASFMESHLVVADGAWYVAPSELVIPGTSILLHFLQLVFSPDGCDGVSEYLSDGVISVNRHTAHVRCSIWVCCFTSVADELGREP